MPIMTMKMTSVRRGYVLALLTRFNERVAVAVVMGARQRSRVEMLGQGKGPGHRRRVIDWIAAASGY